MRRYNIRTFVGVLNDIGFSAVLRQIWFSAMRRQGRKNHNCPDAREIPQSFQAFYRRLDPSKVVHFNPANHGKAESAQRDG
ncbi:MAG: hypothetical protein ACJAYE_001250 [Candidatus Azotimanducaceae bacterium]|jgi:hypothetical protein